MNKKRLFTLFIVLFLLYALWLGYQLSSFDFSGRNTDEPVSRPLHGSEVVGVYHIHSTFSDGRKEVEDIARIAQEVSLDFIILADHGKPNFESLESEGWKEGLLVLAGAELSVNRGHLVALGFRRPERPFSRIAEQAVQEITALGGFTVIAHPYSKARWSWGEHVDYSGIELLDVDTMLKTNFISLIPILPGLLISPEKTLLRMLDYPERSFRKWDELSAIRPLSGYYSADAHLFYRPMLSLLRLHVLLPRPLPDGFEVAKEEVLTALRKGRFFNAVDAAAPPHGFAFWGERGGEIYSMGATVDRAGPVTLHVRAPFSFPKEIRLLKGGRPILRTEEGSVEFEVASPGVYRVEVFLRKRTPLKKNIPWIVTNPVYIGKEKT